MQQRLTRLSVDYGDALQLHWPYTTWIALFVLSILTLTNGSHVFFPKNWSAANFLGAYITLPIFLALYVGYKALRRTPFATKVSEIDIVTGKKAMEELSASYTEPVLGNWLHKVWLAVA